MGYQLAKTVAMNTATEKKHPGLFKFFGEVVG